MINNPFYKKEGSQFVLYKPNFTPRDSSEFSENTFVSGAPNIIERFESVEALQLESLKLFQMRAESAS
jgi:hypothetical protein